MRSQVGVIVGYLCGEHLVLRSLPDGGVAEPDAESVIPLESREDVEHMKLFVHKLVTVTVLLTPDGKTRYADGLLGNVGDEVSLTPTPAVCAA